MKPANCCYPNCFECPYSDCRWNGISASDYQFSDREDKQVLEECTNLSSDKKYCRSEHGKMKNAEYRKTDGYKNSQNKYRCSERGKKSSQQCSRRNYNKKSNILGVPLGTAIDNIRRYGLFIGKGEFVRTVGTLGRIAVPKKFLSEIGVSEGDRIVYWREGNKIILMSLDRAKSLKCNNPVIPKLSGGGGWND